MLVSYSVLYNPENSILSEDCAFDPVVVATIDTGYLSKLFYTDYLNDVTGNPQSYNVDGCAFWIGRYNNVLS